MMQRHLFTEVFKRLKVENRFRSLIKCTAFVLAAIFCIRCAVGIMVPKNYTREWLSPVPTYGGLYDLDKNTADVLFLGSSHTYAGFCPQVLYDEYGITSYNLGMGNQNLVLNYFWLKEALRTQSPSVVVLECIFAFERFHNPSNTSESACQKSLNYMHWTRNRIDAIRALCEIEPESYEWESFIPNIRYHDRWKELHEEDFTAGEIAKRSGLMGYTAAFRYYCNIEDYRPYDPDREKTDAAEMVPAMKEWGERIADLCREKKIRLILTLTPSTDATLSKHAAIQAFANEQGVEFFDFNTAEVIEQMQYDFKTDNADEEHSSVWGAQKVTHRLGMYLTDPESSAGPAASANPADGANSEIGASAVLQPHEDPQWENTRNYYEGKMRDAALMHIKDIYAYLPALADDRYSVFLSVRGDASSAADERIAEALQDLGLREDIRDLGGDSYFAVIDGGHVLLEERGSEEIYSTGSIRDGKTLFSIGSGGSTGDDNGGFSSIMLDDAEYSVDKPGINFVVVSNESVSILDKVCFDTGMTLEASR